MSMEWRKKGQRDFKKVFCSAYILLLSLCVRSNGLHPSESSGGDSTYVQEERGMGSSPPRCVSRCGGCSPCRAVHVAVSPGTPVIAEYYPEAWRCKCGNRLYMP